MNLLISRVSHITNVTDVNTTVSVRFYINNEAERCKLKEAVNKCKASISVENIILQQGNMLTVDLEPEELVVLVNNLRELSKDLHCNFLSRYIYVAFASAKDILYEGTYNCVDDIIEEISEGEDVIRGIVDGLKSALGIIISNSPFPIYMS